MGCQDAIFCPKIFLQDRKEHKNTKWNVLIDLVKTYGSLQHNVIKIVQDKMATHPILIKLIMKLHHDFKVKLKFGKEKEIISYMCGVRQCNNLAKTISIMVMQVNAIEIEEKLEK